MALKRVKLVGRSAAREIEHPPGRWIEVRNGETGYSSSEIIANPLLCSTNDPMVTRLRDEFNGEIAG